MENIKVVNLSDEALIDINGGGVIRRAGEYFGDKVSSFLIKYGVPIAVGIITRRL